MRGVVVVGLLAACHSSHPAMGDAAGSGGSDAVAIPDGLDGAPDAPRGTITVTVYGDNVDRGPGELVPGADVYFVAPDGMTTHVTTGVDGIATAQEPDNTTVWIAHHNSSAYAIETYEGVQVGDSIIGGDPVAPGPDTDVGTAYIAFPSFSDATAYKLALSCTSGTTGSSSPLSNAFVGCAQEMAANAIVWATDSMGNLGYTSATGVDLTAHTSAGTALALPAFQPGASLGVTFTNLPFQLGESSADIFARYTYGTDPTNLQVIELAEDTLTDTMTSSAPIAPFGDHTRVNGLVYIGANAYALNYDGTTPALVSSVTIDASTMVHPAKTWTYDSVTNSVTWTQLAIGVNPTVVRSTLNWNNSPSVNWYVTAPYSGSPSLALPAFPTELISLTYPPKDATFKQVDLTSYAGKTYHDILVGQAGGAPSWHVGVGP